MKKLAVAIATSVAVIVPIQFAAPAQAAPPSVTITYAAPGLTSGSALTTGAQLELFGPVPDSVNVRENVTVNVAVNYGGVPPRAYEARWYACPTRTSNLADCGNAISITNGGGAPPTSLTFQATQNYLGKYLRYWINVSNANGEASTTQADGARQPLIWPALATGERPTFASAPTPGNQSNISLKAWNLAAGTTFASRTVQVWSCPNSANGQIPTFAWNARGDGCTDVSSGISSTFNTAAATTIAMNVPAGTEGRFLVVSDLVVARFGTNSTGALVRSEAVPVGATPSPSPSPSASPSASPSPSATIENPGNPSARPNAAGQFRVAVTSKPSVTRGSRLKVTVSTSSATSMGEATVQIKKRPTARASAKQTLKSIDIVNGTGQSVTMINGRLPKGSYFLVATYRDDTTNRKTITTAPLTIK